MPAPGTHPVELPQDTINLETAVEARDPVTGYDRSIVSVST